MHVFAPEPGNGVGDPVKVSQNSIQYARDKQYDVVVVDTAGRLGIDQELMKQAANIRDAVNPDEILFVVDAMIGQDAVTTAQAFLDGVGFDGVVLTKLDGDARGGAALSVAQVTGRQVMFASNGEKLEDFDVFHPDRMASRILGMGDVLSLIEQAEQAFDAEQSEKMARKIMVSGAEIDAAAKAGYEATVSALLAPAGTDPGAAATPPPNFPAMKEPKKGSAQSDYQMVEWWLAAWPPSPTRWWRSAPSSSTGTSPPPCKQ